MTDTEQLPARNCSKHFTCKYLFLTAFWSRYHYWPLITDEGIQTHRGWNLTMVTASKLQSQVQKWTPTVLNHYAALCLHICTQMLTCTCANKCCMWRDMCLSTWVPTKQRLSALQGPKINFHVLEMCCFHRISPTAGRTSRDMKYTEWTVSQPFVFARKECIYFTCQNTDFHSLGDILMWFKSDVGSVWYVALLDQYKTLSNLEMSITK